MKKFLGTKLIYAAPMTRAEYNRYRGWDLPANENGEDQGMLVEYVDGGQANHPGHAGYISWSPKDVFDRAYHEVTGLTFGQAIAALKTGLRVARAGWNGKGMYLYHVAAGRYPPVSESAKLIAANEPDGRVPYRDYIVMKTVTGEVVPWLASQSDVLDEDWMIVE